MARTTKTKNTNTDNIAPFPAAGDNGLSLADLLGPAGFGLERIEIPELKGHVFFKMVAAKDMLAFEELAADRTEGETDDEFIARTPAADRNNAMAELIVKCITDKDGKPLFKNAEQPKEIPIAIFMRFSREINQRLAGRLKDITGEAGKESAAPSTVSPTT